jgi:endonuclease YncB( thermonuclease family)
MLWYGCEKLLRFAAQYAVTAALFAIRLIIAIAFLAGLVAVAARAECKGQDGGVSVVTALHDGEILILDDGRTVKLAGILTPKRARNGPLAEARATMEKALSVLVVGKKVELRLNGRKRDRYGRLMAQAFVVNGKDREWVEGKLTAEGLVRVISSWDSRACARELLAMENSAREAGKGLWGTGFFAVRSAAAEAVLTGLARNYEIVEGQVQNVAEIKGNVYINFGRNWRRDFTAFISRKRVKLFNETAVAKAKRAMKGQSPIGNAEVGERNTPALVASTSAVPIRSASASVSETSAATKSASATSTKFDFARYKGQHIRVRGWLYYRNGPSIKVTHPEQIEIINTQLAQP